MRKLLIVGAGETAKLAYEYFTYDSPFEVVAFAVDADFLTRTELYGLPVVPLDCVGDTFAPGRCEAFVALGSGNLNTHRARLVDRVRQQGYTFASYVSSRAAVWRNVQIGSNCFIQDNCTIQPFAKIGNNVTLWSGTFVGHRTVIDDNAFIGAHSVIAGFCHIGRNSFLGVNCAITDSVEIGDDSYIAMGTAMTRSSAANTLWQGNPGKHKPISASDFCRLYTK